MNRQFIMNSTRLAIIHLKELNYKLCKKGLLERCLGMNIFVGEFKKQKNDFIKESLTSSENAQENLNASKKKVVENEITKLEKILTALEHTVVSIKCDVKSKTSSAMYEVWIRRVNIISAKFKSMYSKIANEKYNRIYKMNKEVGTTWKNVSVDLKWLKENVSDFIWMTKQLTIKVLVLKKVTWKIYSTKTKTRCFHLHLFHHHHKRT